MGIFGSCGLVVAVSLAGCRRVPARPESQAGVRAEAAVPKVSGLYTDDEARALVRAAETVVPVGSARRRTDVFQDLHIDSERLREKRVEKIMRVATETWQLSESFDIKWLEDPNALDDERREIYGIRVLERRPVTQDLESAGLLSNQPLQRTGLAPRR
jgi:hypothetical protein